MPERTERGGATTPPRRRQGYSGHMAALETALKIVEARKSVVMKPRRPSPGRQGASTSGAQGRLAALGEGQKASTLLRWRRPGK